MYVNQCPLTIICDVDRGLKASIEQAEDTSYTVGIYHQTRFEHAGGSILDIKQAILAFERALQNSTLNRDEKGKRQAANGLGTSYLRCFEQLGESADIDKSIFHLQHALHGPSDLDFDKHILLNSLAMSLHRRFERFGNFADISRSVSAAESALEFLPPENNLRADLTAQLGISLRGRYGNTGDLADLDKSIEASKEAVELTQDGDAEKPRRLNGLGFALYWRFQHTANLVALDEAIMWLQRAVEFTQDNDPEKPRRLNNLGIALLSRFNIYHQNTGFRTCPSSCCADCASIREAGDCPDLHQSILVLRAALRLSSNDHPFTSDILVSLGKSLVCIGDHYQAMEHFTKAARSYASQPSTAFKGASLWVKCARILGCPSLLEGYEVSLKLIHRMAWLGLPMSDRHNHLVGTDGTLRDAAAAAIERGQYETAIKWLEQGRSIVWGQCLSLRASVDGLRRHEPQLADKLSELAKQLDQTSFQAGHIDELDQELAAQRHRRLTVEWEELVKKVQAVSGFETFLLPLVDLSQLSLAARDGPIVILNVSQFRCDALVLRTDEEVLHIPLPHLTYEDAQGLQESLQYQLSNGRCISFERLSARRVTNFVHMDTFEEILSKLWLDVAKPVIDRLALTVCLVTDTSGLRS